MSVLERLLKEESEYESGNGWFLTKEERKQAAVELAELEAIKEAAWKLIEHPTSEAKLQALARVLGVEL
jgi:hypothetical protein